jgi:predicted DNA binding CopG/RHH family protein
MKATRKRIPEFTTEAEEALFWQDHDSADYVDWSTATPGVFPELRPSLKSISIRLPQPMIDRLRTMAHERDVPYQSLIKMILADRLAKG